MNTETIDRPIFLLGTGRSGTTIFLRILGRHPDVAWISNYTNRFPSWPQLAFLSRVLDIDTGARYVKTSWRLTPKPVEPNESLRAITLGDFTQPRPLGPDDVSQASAQDLRAFVGAHLRWQGKSRFLNKHTGFPRIHYFKQIFPDAKFVHVMRDGRAVVNSLLNMKWWDGTLKTWWWGEMSPEYAEEYARSDSSPVVLAAIVWKTLMSRIDEQARTLSAEDLYTVRYDAFAADYRAVIKKVTAFADLPFNSRFDSRLGEFVIRSTDDRWKTELSREQRALAERSLEADLQKFGFFGDVPVEYA